MCCAEFIVKYVLFGANLLFTLAGLALIGVGVAVLVQLNQILDLIPVSLNAIPISVIVLGCVVFLIAFFGCCGAIRESRCLLTMYFICMGILAGCKIYLATVIFGSLSTLSETVREWLETAFASDNLRTAFHAMEALFQCCGTTGPGSYVGVLEALPPTCCPALPAGTACDVANAYGGCSDRVGSYFSSFGEAIGGIIVAIIVVEVFGVCSVIAAFAGYLLLRRYDMLVDLQNTLILVMSAGAVIFVVTFIGSCGAILDGVLAKYLLFTYIALLSIVVMVNIYILAALHISHRGGSGPVTSALTAEFPPEALEEPDHLDLFSRIKPSHSNKTDDHTDTSITRIIDDKRKSFTEAIINKSKDINTAIDENLLKSPKSDEYMKKVGSFMQGIKDKRDTIKNRVGTLAHRVTDFSPRSEDLNDEIGKGRHPRFMEKVTGAIHAGVDGVKAVVRTGYDLTKLTTRLAKDIVEIIKVVLKFFVELSSEEEDRVKPVRPLLRNFTTLLYRLTEHNIVQYLGLAVIIMEILYILLVGYLSTTKKDYNCYYIRT